jgi:hypothetical protein
MGPLVYDAGGTYFKNKYRDPMEGCYQYECECDGTGARSAVAAYVRTAYTNLVSDNSFIERALAHMVNHRVQDFQDPLTSTLVLMATSPLQMIMCEAGMLPFKTNLLPVLPYALLTADERKILQDILAHVPNEQMHETIESSGQYTLTVLPFTQNMGSSSTSTILCKRRLLHAFVSVLLSAHPSTQVGRTLSNIVLQRFMAQVPTSSDVISSVMALLTHQTPPPSAPAPVLAKTVPVQPQPTGMMLLLAPDNNHDDDEAKPTCVSEASQPRRIAVVKRKICSAKNTEASPRPLKKFALPAVYSNDAST